MPRKYKSSAQHGGRRQGRPGQAYGNRSDLNQAPRAVPGQTYGQAGAQLAAQRQIPLPRQAPAPSGPAPAGNAPAGPPPPAGAAPSLPMPGPIGAPTANPNEPLTAGLPSGPGAGPEALGPQAMSPIDEMRAMFMANPNDDMRRLIAYIDGY